MEILLNNIESSEVNNPLLTAALQEIEQLKDLIDKVKDILASRVLSIKEGDEPCYIPTLAQENGEKIEILSNFLFK